MAGALWGRDLSPADGNCFPPKPQPVTPQPTARRKGPDIGTKKKQERKGNGKRRAIGKKSLWRLTLPATVYHRQSGPSPPTSKLYGHTIAWTITSFPGTLIKAEILVGTLVGYRQAGPAGRAPNDKRHRRHAGPVFRQLVKEAESTPRLRSEGLDGPEIKQIASLVSAGTESPSIYYKYECTISSQG